jgi:cytochrome c
MLTLALDSTFYVAYDLAHCTLYKAWKGGVMLEGAAFTNKKNVQPTSWGAAYYDDAIQHSKWVAQSNGKEVSSRIVSKGYIFQDSQIYLKYLLILSTGDTIHLEERPEFIRSETGNPGLERLFKMSPVPDGLTVSLTASDTVFTLNAKKQTSLITYFNSLPPQFPPQPEEEYDSRGRYWIEKSDCFTCHELDKKTVGPSFHQIAQRYDNEKSVSKHLIQRIKEGGSGVWGIATMNPHPNLTENEIKTMLDYILSLKPGDEKENNLTPEIKKVPDKNLKPGFGLPLEGVHPSYDVSTIDKYDFKPRVGGLAFLPEGGLLVTTWDSTGGVYLLNGVETGDTNKITVKRIASGLQEPLGITVVDGKIFVLQKPELTQLIDLDGDEIIDEYRTVCNAWGVTGDFHEFAFGLVYKDGYFYATLSLAMRLMSNEKQQPDRGKTIKIGMDGSYEWINYGLRQPNGIGLGVDGEIFECENQGEWIPCNKLIHIKKGDYHGMPWGILPDSLSKLPPITPPAIMLPEDEIANSPSQPVLMQDGPYKGQMLHGDVTHGGLQRDFLEKINGEYQGAVFRFSQGLEAGVNRLCWGPDGALYAGEIGMVGGWSWKEKQYGLQRMKYNGKLTFEMLAVRAKPGGFEIEFTDALNTAQNISPSDFLIQQWWYLPTEDYGGPKMNLEKLKISRITISKDRRRIFLEIPGLKKEHVVYFRIPAHMQSAGGQSLWSSEAWYTLNNIPE